MRPGWSWSHWSLRRRRRAVARKVRAMRRQGAGKSGKRPTPAEVDRSLRRLLLQPADTVRKPQRNAVDAIGAAMIRKAIAGDVDAAIEIANRTEGPVLCPRCGWAAGEEP